MRSIVFDKLFIFLLFIYCFADQEQICYDYVGCFSVPPEFYDPILRPFNPLPLSPFVINTSFLLLTKQNIDSPQLISYSNRETITQSHFSNRRRLKIICHGFLSSANSRWVKLMAKNILEKDDVNVILVDWSEGAYGGYSQVVANSRLVGRQIGLLLKMLQDSFNFDLNNAHIIGHSIGAHIAGYAGEYLNKQLGRISGLDPARPNFEFLPPVVRLDTSDAKFVDIIHTTGTNFYYLGVGLLQPIGHVDIYVDGGDMMRSCETGNFLETIFSHGPLGIYETIACNHNVAHDIYIESIRQKCPFTAYACDDLEAYKTGKCASCNTPGKDCTQMGYYADQYNYEGDENTKFYISISDQPHQSCLYHWLVTIRTTREWQPRSSVNVYITIKGESNSLKKVKIGNKDYEFSSNTAYHFLLEVNKPIGKIEEIEFWLEIPSGWKNTYNLDDCKDGASERYKFKEIIFIPLDIINNKERESSSFRFCNSLLGCGIPPNVTTTLKPTSNC